MASVLSEPEASLPAKCALCRAELPAEQFERQLDEEQRSLYLSFVAMRALSPGEVTVPCTMCPYFEIYGGGGGGLPAIFFCKRCDGVHCCHCKATLPTICLVHDGDDEANAKQAVIEEHLVCVELAPYKQRVEAALDEGAVMRCPTCGLGGRKDGSCTHMGCVRCGEAWCYCCGLSVAAMDKAPRGGAGELLQQLAPKTLALPRPSHPPPSLRT